MGCPDCKDHCVDCQDQCERIAALKTAMAELVELSEAVLRFHSQPTGCCGWKEKALRAAAKLCDMSERLDEAQALVEAAVSMAEENIGCGRCSRNTPANYEAGYDHTPGCRVEKWLAKARALAKENGK